MLDQVQRQQAVERSGVGASPGLVGHRQEVAERQVAPAEGAEALLEVGDQVEQDLEPIAADRRGGIRLRPALGRLQAGAGQAVLDQDRLHLRLGRGRTAAPSCRLDHVERRLGDVQVPLGHESGHLAVEEGHQQGPDVRAVHVGVAHHHDLAVPPSAGSSSSPIPLPTAVMMLRTSSLPSTRSSRARSTLRILPRSGRIAW